MENFTQEELYHWGIKGMRWGVRRYQNSDGTLTSAGKKRYDKELSRLRAEQKVVKNKQATKAKIDKLTSKRQELEQQKKDLEGESRLAQVKQKSEERKANKPKKHVKDMSDEELSQAIARMKLEEQYKEYMSKNETKQKASLGERFINTVVKDMLVPAATDAGKQLVKSSIVKAVNEGLGLEGEYKLATNNKKK